jgi:Aspartyl protease
MLKTVIFGVLLTFWLCSCATQSSIYPWIPATVALNKEGGRGDWIMVTLRLENGEELPFVLDTGCPVTVFEKSLKLKLGKSLGKKTFWNFGVKQESDIYAASRLYLGNTLLLTGTNVGTFDELQLAEIPGHPLMGILGMDVLEHYCIQLDFKNGKIRFLDDQRAKKKDWGKPFPLFDSGDGCFAIDDNLVGRRHSGSLIDTGCNGDGWLTPQLFQQWTNQAPPLTNGEVRFPQGILGGEIYHDLDLHDLKENPHDPHMVYNGIGLRVLCQNLVTLDFPNQTLYLKRTSDWALVDKKMGVMARAAARSALKYLEQLHDKNQLPGMYAFDYVQTTSFHFNHDLDSITWDLRINGYSALYHYTMTRTAHGGSWKLTKTWRTNQNDRTIKEYPIP